MPGPFCVRGRRKRICVPAACLSLCGKGWDRQAGPQRGRYARNAGVQNASFGIHGGMPLKTRKPTELQDFY